MAISIQGCSVCGQRFEVKFGFQVQALAEGPAFFCSQSCHEQDLFRQRQRVCTECGTQFELRYAFQQLTAGTAVRFFCSTGCRTAAVSPPRAATVAAGPIRIAVLNQKGGTGKTTTSVNLAAGLAHAGSATLLLDLDSQGHVSASLGAIGKRGTADLLMSDTPASQCVSQLRKRLHGFIGNERLAEAEIGLARMGDGRERVLIERLRPFEDSYEYVVIDCGPAMSLLNINALMYTDYVLVPVSCEYLSLVGVKQMLRTLDRLHRQLGKRAEILGILPTFYDRRIRISDEAVKTLQGYFRDKVLPPIRVNTRLKEAPQHSQSIFEYAPQSRGAKDYADLVERVQTLRRGMPTSGQPFSSFGLGLEPGGADRRDTGSQRGAEELTPN